MYTNRDNAEDIKNCTAANRIDLFVWASSGYHYLGDQVTYKPFCYCNGLWPASYRYGPAEENLTGVNANCDWGVFNAILNGGDEPGRWRTLSRDEWAYLMNGRTNATSLRAIEIPDQVGDDKVLPAVMADLIGHLLPCRKPSGSVSIKYPPSPAPGPGWRI